MLREHINQPLITIKTGNELPVQSAITNLRHLGILNLFQSRSNLNL